MCDFERSNCESWGWGERERLTVRLILSVFFQGSLWRGTSRALVLLLLMTLVAKIQIVTEARAQGLEQIDLPDRKFVFLEDLDKEREKKSPVRAKQIDEKRRRLKERKQMDLPFDITASSIKYDTAKKVVICKGGVIIGYPTGIVEADEATFSTETSEAEIRGDVRIDDLAADLLAESATINLKTGKGVLRNAHVRIVEGGYKFDAAEVVREDQDTFSFKDVEVTTCNCPTSGACLPWSMAGSSGKATIDGYGSIWNGVMYSCGVPVLYTPYALFPVKTERQSGLLPSTFGEGRRSGFKFDLPYYWAISRSADATLTGIFEAKTRDGAMLEYRSYLSRKHELSFGSLYLNESRRDGDLQGTKVEDLADPSLDENRLAGYLDYYLSSDIGDVPVQVLADGRYVSDDLLLREVTMEDIGEYNSRFVTSRATLRLMPLDTWSFNTMAEFNQAMVTDDDFIFQRLPSVQFGGYERFKVFGENQYGLKLVTQTKFSTVKLDRKKSYDGLKSEAYENWTVPFYYQNYLEGKLVSDIRLTKYNLDENREIRKKLVSDDEGQTVEQDQVVSTLPSSSDRLLPSFGASVSTVLERVFDVSETNPVKTVSDLGPQARARGLSRLKHSIKPALGFRYTPFVDQTENPQFESYDRLPQREVLTFSLVNRLFGKFEQLNPYLFGIEESAPSVRDLGYLGEFGDLDRRSGASSEINPLNTSREPVMASQVAELGTFSLSQSYDFLEEKADDTDTEEDAESKSQWSDLGLMFMALPNQQFRFGGGLDYNWDSSKVSEYSLRTQLIDKRGDEIRLRMLFNDGLTRQLETGAQVRILERLKAGVYARYDDMNKRFIEHRYGLRFYSSCKCWMLDIDVHDRINPDETQLNVKLTLLGIGSVGNTLFTETRSKVGQ